jgi:hypothetical protein
MSSGIVRTGRPGFRRVAHHSSRTGRTYQRLAENLEPRTLLASAARLSEMGAAHAAASLLPATEFEAAKPKKPPSPQSRPR